ncbi:hypothetical protein ABZ413_24570 [Nocardia rhamnosiphila]|uniref:AMP-binding enzyme n=1 Tax=Nocardia rhamnosiphila TaxID=426716 RepID=UPI0033EC29CB
MRRDLWLNSTSGGTDVCSGFVGGVPTLPVLASAIQRRCLGADVAAVDESGHAVVGEVGELVVRKPMPSMPIGFVDDPGDVRYRASYFERLPGMWSHGDWISIDPSGSVVVSGRSDATINKFGVRMGPAEIYDAVDTLAGIRDSLAIGVETGSAGYLMVLFVVPVPEVEVDDTVRWSIRAAIRQRVSPRHVPDEIVSAPGIPRTHTGKKLEIPVKRLLQGVALDDAVDLRTVADPDLVRWYARWGERRITQSTTEENEHGQSR